MKSKIEWTQQTWNPIVGCSVVSPGCTNCYAMKMAARIEAMGTMPIYAGLTQRTKAGAVWTGQMRFAANRLTEPLSRKKPTTYFVNSMSDLFHESVPDEWIDRIFAVMALAPQHTFQVLTKRSGRMRDYMQGDWSVRIYHMIEGKGSSAAGVACGWLIAGKPLPNIWFGVSVEDQTRADERIPDLLATPAAVRFISAEPLLGPIDLTGLNPGGAQVLDALSGVSRNPTYMEWPTLAWVIVGGESGPGARPMREEWARSLRDQCAAAHVPFFFKQWGGVRKKDAGRVLDGTIHDAMPKYDSVRLDGVKP